MACTSQKVNRMNSVMLVQRCSFRNLQSSQSVLCFVSSCAVIWFIQCFKKALFHFHSTSLHNYIILLKMYTSWFRNTVNTISFLIPAIWNFFKLSGVDYISKLKSGYFEIYNACNVVWTYHYHRAVSNWISWNQKPKVIFLTKHRGRRQLKERTCAEETCATDSRLILVLTSLWKAKLRQLFEANV